MSLLLHDPFQPQQTMLTSTYLSHLFGGEAVHGLLGQDAVGLTEPFPHLIDSLMRLLLHRTVYPINPGFEVARATF
jgi:hypothetical protein